ncbi:MAG: DUF4012 domain-containing protein [Caldilineaceae bacterium]|nr:DUF4012 domain-containing protein [Caldilineaceae bacterium]
MFLLFLALLLCPPQQKMAHAEQGLVTNVLLPTVQSFRWRLQPVLTDLLGESGPRTYLVLVQNNHELRATGGFISAVGKVTLENGELAEFDFVDSYAFFQETLAYGPAPKPMQEYMNIQLLLLRDANWSPDLPTTAKLIQSLYTQQTGIPVAGVITVDLDAAALVVDAIGPLALPGAAPITGSTFVEQVVQLWERPLGTDLQVNSTEFNEWWGQRKNFVTDLVQAARARLQDDDVSYFKLLWNLQQALQQRSIQVWVTEPYLAQQLRVLGWDGGLYADPDADLVALVDTNMGFNKVDAVLGRSLSYTVTWPDGPTQPALATATITYTHPISVPNYTCTNAPEYGDNYSFLIERCYYDYVRLYTPIGSRLESVEGVEPDSVVTQRAENRTQYFAGYFILPVGEQHTVTFRYRLPAAFTPDTYRLLVRRQAGTHPLPFTLTFADQPITTTLTNNKWRWSAP